uniref:Family with sequence similarity 170, member A n=1 Tax=Mus musculus TaxID=10090 RepID=A0A494BAJ2_MOUSE
MKRRQKRKHLEIEESKEAGISKSQEDISHPESTGVPKAQSPGEPGNCYRTVPSLDHH